MSGMTCNRTCNASGLTECVLEDCKGCRAHFSRPESVQGTRHASPASESRVRAGGVPHGAWRACGGGESATIRTEYWEKVFAHELHGELGRTKASRNGQRAELWVHGRMAGAGRCRSSVSVSASSPVGAGTAAVKVKFLPGITGYDSRVHRERQDIGRWIVDNGY